MLTFFFRLGRDDGKNKEESSAGVFRLLSIPTIWIALCNIIFSTMSNGFLSITLEPQVLRHVRFIPFLLNLSRHIL
jgi:hypothetical protein